MSVLPFCHQTAAAIVNIVQLAKIMFVICIIADIDECHSAPCFNNGSCVGDVSGYTCTCLSGYTGSHCEIGNGVLLSSQL